MESKPQKKSSPAPAVSPEGNPSFADPRGAGGNGPNRRQSVVDRRVGMDRRQMSAEESGYTGPERRVASGDRREDTGLERRRGPRPSPLR
jgi:hypothetical protein